METTDSTMTTVYSERLAKTLPGVRDRIEQAVATAGRDGGSVRLVAVTKAHPLEAVEAALQAGLSDLGENRVEELEGKVAALGRAAATWHMIGHVQSRKARQALELSDLIHSVDSAKLAQRLARMAHEEGQLVHVLVQVNTSGETAKSGFDLARAVDDVLPLAELPGLEIDGLMTMAPFSAGEGVLSRAFGGLREVHEQLRTQSGRIGPELSMGMTNDLEIAIREGSTMVRIGTALFGPRTQKALSGAGQ
jgi:pyridoxal phosphate enzyme (YggS family)